MVITLDSELAAALTAQAKARGMTPEQLAVTTLRSRFTSLAPRDEWERRLVRIGSDCGVSLSNEAISSEGIYE